MLETKEEVSGHIDAHAIQIDDTKGIELERLTADFERALLIKALEQTGGVKKRAAKLLNISFRSMRYRVDKYSLSNMSIDDDEDEVATETA